MKQAESRAGSEFANDVRTGLSSSPKRLSSKYFYDDEGSRLFQRIMELPEYYLTRVETEIFETRAEEMLQAFSGESEEFDLIELGAGDGSKTALLIDHFLKRGARIRFSPVDISSAALETLTSAFRQRFPQLQMNALTGDYFRMLESLGASSRRKKVVLFLGSNIGNYGENDARVFFGRLHTSLAPGDLLLTGFDLEKDPRVILAAYDDAEGVTAEFNLNLLRRINRELGGDFDLAKFSHYATYSPEDRAARSYLLSRTRQTVRIADVGRSFDFEPWEPIHTEISQKYGMETIEAFARSAGFAVRAAFTDSRGYFVDSLWERV